jgi:microbial collagenase
LEGAVSVGKEVRSETVSSAVAVITAGPVKGYSPLTVKFSGKKSFSRSGRIVSYHWDFGDGDISDKKNTENTYLSTTFGPREFTATLTVKDQTGAVASATSVIEVDTH